MLGSGTATLLISSDEMNDIIKIMKTLEYSGVLLEGVTKTIENETKEQRGGFLPVLLGTLGSSLLGNSLSGGEGVIRAGEGIKKNKSNLQIPFHSLTNCKTAKYYKNETRFNGVYSRDNLPKTIKKSAYVINLDEYADAGTHWIALYVKNKKVVYFDNFGVEHVPKALEHVYEHELQKTNQKEFRIEKVIKGKGDKLYVKWKGYDNSFNSWINENDIIR